MKTSMPLNVSRLPSASVVLHGAKYLISDVSPDGSIASRYVASGSLIRLSLAGQQDLYHAGLLVLDVAGDQR